MPYYSTAVKLLTTDGRSLDTFNAHSRINILNCIQSDLCKELPKLCSRASNRSNTVTSESSSRQTLLGTVVWDEMTDGEQLEALGLAGQSTTAPTGFEKV